jgi:hypothetical protein
MNLRSMPAAPGCVRQPALALLLLLVAACGDPGSGGTGVPTATAPAAPPPTSDPSLAPTPSPTPSPPAGAPAAGIPDPGCRPPADASTAPFTGIVEAQSGGCLLVGGRSILVTDARVLLRSGGESTLEALVTGLTVTVEPDPADPGLARTVTIEDSAP